MAQRLDALTADGHWGATAKWGFASTRTGAISVKLFSFKIMLWVLLPISVVSYSALMVWMSFKPPYPQVLKEPGKPQGYATVHMIAGLMSAQMDSFGGWLPNDLTLTPGAVQDNLPNFQLGVLQVVRHSARVLRDNLSRQRTSDAVHRETDQAHTAYNNDPFKWAFPSAENAFKRGNSALRRFAGELGGSANVYPRADNLIELLKIFISELGTVSTRLLEAQDSGKVSWFEIDDNFYFAQGVGFAMYGMMLAVREDFKGVLTDKNALKITDLIVNSLKSSQFEPWLITNGAKNGFLANHSNNLKVFLDDARQKLKSLESILDQG